MGLSYFQIVVRHAALNRYRVLSGTDWYTVNLKARRQYEAWEREWIEQQAVQHARKLEVSRRADEARTQKRREQQSALARQCEDWAARQTADALHALDTVRTTLVRTLGVNDAIEWDCSRRSHRPPTCRLPARRRPNMIPGIRRRSGCSDA